MYGRKPRCSRRECTSTRPSAKPITAPIPKPNAASLAVKSDLWSRIVAERAGWFTCAGCLNAFRIVHTCGIDVSSTTNGHVQPADVQT